MSTYVPIQSVVLSNFSNTISLSNIPQNYTDLVLVLTGNVTGNGEPDMFFNGDFATNYSWTALTGYGTTSITDARYVTTNRPMIGGYQLYWPNSTVYTASCQVQINNYASTTTQKLYLSRDNNIGASYGGTSGEMGAYVGLWRNTAAITSITIALPGGSFNAGTTLDLYGIKSGAPKMMGGDVVVTDGSYWYHAFKTTGSISTILQQPVTADILLVGGGGGSGGYYSGGGSGAGGVLALASQTITQGTYTITVGAGGYAGTTGAGTGGNGNNSSFGSLTAAVGGGYGGQGGTMPGQSNRNAASGGSGGGGGGDTNPGTAGTGTSGQGNNGGAGGTAGSNYRGGGGGGAGGAGVAGDTSGNGGAAVTTVTGWGSLSAMLTATGLGVSGAIAGGGGGGIQTSPGGTVGVGGGGGAGDGAKANGANGPSPTIQNTGSGAGGAGGASVYGGIGASGVVVVRYAV
jgi:hypothetical protein